MEESPDPGKGKHWRVLLPCRHSVQLRQNSHHLHMAKTDDQACRPGCNEVVKLEYSNGTGKFASVHVEVTFRSITGIPVYVIQEASADNNHYRFFQLSA